MTVPAGTPSTETDPAADRRLTPLDGLTLLALLLAGALIGLLGAFLVPQRLFGGLEGLSGVIALLGNLGLCLVGGIGLRRRLGVLAPGLGWLVAVGTISSVAPGGDVIIPGTLPTDPGVTTVGTVFLLLGVVGIIAANVAVTRWLRPLRADDRERAVAPYGQAVRRGSR